MDGNGKMINELLLQERSDGILGITMNNPDKLNALSESMIDALKEALDEAAETSDTKCIVLRGAGRAFCAGHDLKELSRGAKRAGPGSRILQNDFRQMRGADDVDRSASSAGNCGGSRRCRRGRVPTGRHLRHGRCG